MKEIRGRVLSLPSMADVREEAVRAGVGEEILRAFASGFGAEMVKLDGVTHSVAATLRTLIPSPAGLVVAYPGGEEREARGEGTRGERDAHAPGHSVLLAGARPELIAVAARLEDSSDPTERATGAELLVTLERYDGKHLAATRCGNVTLEWGRRTYVMGIVNVTPNSFSGDGLDTNVDAAVGQALRFIEEGADILDVGGESTRPGFESISAEEEITRVVPVIRRLAAQVSVPISVDSYKVEVVRRALDAGATIVNDIWGLRHDPALAKLAAEYDAPIVLMHNRRSITTRTELGGHVKAVEYSDLMGEVIEDLRWSIDMAVQCGVKLEKVIVDPGIGFGKTPQHNIVVMRRQRELKSLGRPVLMGTSRKSFIGLTLGLPVDDRVEGTGATVALSIVNGADIVRVHDVKQMARISRMTDAIVRPILSNES